MKLTIAQIIMILHLLTVDKDGVGFHYGFKLKPEIQKEFDELEEAEREKRIEEDNKETFSLGSIF